uniref:afadin-like isoform X1 n=2 Tax=Myxine glutinosa TaxID=7769 RepID=UPI00358FF7A0
MDLENLESQRVHLLEDIRRWNAQHPALLELSMPEQDLSFCGVVKLCYKEDTTAVAVTKCVQLQSTSTTLDTLRLFSEKLHVEPDSDWGSSSLSLHELLPGTGERQLEDVERPLLLQLGWPKEGRFLVRNKVLLEPGGDDNTKMENIQCATNTQRVAILRQGGKNRQSKRMSRWRHSLRSLLLDGETGQNTSSNGHEDTESSETGVMMSFETSCLGSSPRKCSLLLSPVESAHSVVTRLLHHRGVRDEPRSYCLAQVVKPCGPGEAWESELDEGEFPFKILQSWSDNNGRLMFQLRRKLSTFSLRERRGSRDSLAPSTTSTAVADTISLGPSENETLPESPPGSNTDKEADEAFGDVEGGEQSMPFLLDLKPAESSPGLFFLQYDELIIGSERCKSGQEIRIVVTGPGIHPRHCHISKDTGHVTVTPCGPETEVRVEGQNIEGPTPLKPGAILQLGDAKFLKLAYEGQVPEVQAVNPAAVTSNIKKESEQQPNQNSSSPLCSSPRTKTTHSSERHLPLYIKINGNGMAEDAFLDGLLPQMDAIPHGFPLTPAYTVYSACRFLLSESYMGGKASCDQAALLAKKASDLLERRVEESPHLLVSVYLMANASELLFFLQKDKDLQETTIVAQESLACSTQTAFCVLVDGLQEALQQELPALLQDSDTAEEPRKHIGHVLTLFSDLAEALQQTCVNLALLVQIFSRLFALLGVFLFNVVMRDTELGLRSRYWGCKLGERLVSLVAWAEQRGLERIAECHLGHLLQAIHLLTMSKAGPQDVQGIINTCFRLNSVQLRVLLDSYQYAPSEPLIPQVLTEQLVALAEESTDREGEQPPQLEESMEFHLPYVLPEDGYSSECLHGVPKGFSEALNVFGLTDKCQLLLQPPYRNWMVFFNCGENYPVEAKDLAEEQEQPAPLQVVNIQLQKKQGLGFSIIAAKGRGDVPFGVYVKSLVEGGAAQLDGHLSQGDQILSIDETPVVGLSEKSVLHLLSCTGSVVDLQVAKGAAARHGLAGSLNQAMPQSQTDHIHNQPRHVGDPRRLQRPQSAPGNALIAGWTKEAQTGPEGTGKMLRAGEIVKRPRDRPLIAAGEKFEPGTFGGAFSPEEAHTTCAGEVGAMVPRPSLLNRTETKINPVEECVDVIRLLKHQIIRLERKQNRTETEQVQLHDLILEYHQQVQMREATRLDTNNGQNPTRQPCLTNPDGFQAKPRQILMGAPAGCVRQDGNWATSTAPQQRTEARPAAGDMNRQDETRAHQSSPANFRPLLFRAAAPEISNPLAQHSTYGLSDTTLPTIFEDNRYGRESTGLAMNVQTYVHANPRTAVPIPVVTHTAHNEMRRTPATVANVNSNQFAKIIDANGLSPMEHLPNPQYHSAKTFGAQFPQNVADNTFNSQSFHPLPVPAYYKHAVSPQGFPQVNRINGSQDAGEHQPPYGQINSKQQYYTVEQPQRPMQTLTSSPGHNSAGILDYRRQQDNVASHQHLVEHPPSSGLIHAEVVFIDPAGNEEYPGVSAQSCNAPAVPSRMYSHSNSISSESDSSELALIWQQGALDRARLGASAATRGFQVNPNGKKITDSMSSPMFTQSLKHGLAPTGSELYVTGISSDVGTMQYHPCQQRGTNYGIPQGFEQSVPPGIGEWEMQGSEPVGGQDNARSKVALPEAMRRLLGDIHQLERNVSRSRSEIARPRSAPSQKLMADEKPYYTQTLDVDNSFQLEMWSRESGAVSRYNGVDGQFTPDQSPTQGQDPRWSNHLNSRVNPLPINSRMPMRNNSYGLRHDQRMDPQNNFRVGGAPEEMEAANEIMILEERSSGR